MDSLSPSSKALLFGYSLCSGILDCVEMEKYSRAVSQYIYILYTSLSQIYGLQILLPIWLILSLFTDLDIIFDRCKVCFWWIMILSFHFFFFFCGFKDQTQILMHARNVLYHWASGKFWFTISFVPGACFQCYVKISLTDPMS